MKPLCVVMLMVSVLGACVPPLDFLSGLNAGMAWFWFVELFRWNGGK
jgi:hypothetical protein